MGLSFTQRYSLSGHFLLPRWKEIDANFGKMLSIGRRRELIESRAGSTNLKEFIKEKASAKMVG